MKCRCGSKMYQSPQAQTVYRCDKCQRETVIVDDTQVAWAMFEDGTGAADVAEDFRRDFGWDAEAQVIDACAKIMQEEIERWRQWWLALPWHKKVAYTLWRRSEHSYNRVGWAIRKARWTAHRLLFKIRRALLR